MPTRSARGTVCLLGGSGFVGRRIACQLVQKGYAVRIPTRDPVRARQLLILPSVELVAADIHDDATLQRLVAGCDAVINLIGILNERKRDGSGFRRVHTELIEKLVTACHESNVPRLIQMSALKANADTAPSHYLRSKGAGERVLKELGGADLNWTIFRPSVIFGAEDSFINRFAKILRLCPILPLARPNAVFAPVFVDDVANAFCTALESYDCNEKTFELYGPEELSLEEIILEIVRILDLKRVIIGLPDSLSLVQAWLMDYVVPGKLFTVDNYHSMAVSSVGTADGLRALGITSTSMRMVLPSYLGPSNHQRQLAEFRRGSRR
jgi:uncharacterized protein YbjT (DUF2867 family)